MCQAARAPVECGHRFISWACLHLPEVCSRISAFWTSKFRIQVRLRGYRGYRTRETMAEFKTVRVSRNGSKDTQIHTGLKGIKKSHATESWVASNVPRTGPHPSKPSGSTLSSTHLQTSCKWALLEQNHTLYASLRAGRFVSACLCYRASAPPRTSSTSFLTVICLDVSFSCKHALSRLAIRVHHGNRMASKYVVPAKLPDLVDVRASPADNRSQYGI